MREIVKILNSTIKEIRSTNRYLRNYIDSCHKESLICAAYMKQRTEHFENVANITINSANVIPQEKKQGVRNIFKRILMTKMRQTRVLIKTQ